MKTTRPPTLRVVKEPAITPLEPLQSLGEHGAALWRKITTEYNFADAAGRAMLTMACVNLDRAEALRAQIDAQGIVLQTPYGPRPHAAIGAEQAARNAVTRTLKQLGLLDQPKRDRPGRPPTSSGR